MEKKIVAGDVVRLKAGGPWMTVSQTDDKPGDSVACVWFVMNMTGTWGDIQRMSFGPDVLEVKEQP